MNKADKMFLDLGYKKVEHGDMSVFTSPESCISISKSKLTYSKMYRFTYAAAKITIEEHRAISRFFFDLALEMEL